MPMVLFFGNDPHRMDQAGNVAEECKQNIQQEMFAQSDLQEDANRRQDDGDNNSNEIHG